MKNVAKPNLRPPTQQDIPAVAKLMLEAFASIHDKHNFPRDFPTIEPALQFATAWVNHPQVWGVLAERDGRVIGCNFLTERDPIRGVGPICIDPAEQGGGIGKSLMLAVIERSRQTGAPGIRLLQDAFNNTSMSLYASLGFEVKEPLVVMAGKPAAALATASPAAGLAGNSIVRPMTEADIPVCAKLCHRIHGFDRAGELRDAVKMFRPFVLERGGKIVAYSCALFFWAVNHAVAETVEDLMLLLAGAQQQMDGPISLLVPTRSTALFRACLDQRLRIVKPMTLMTMGEYHEPTAVWSPSVEY